MQPLGIIARLEALGDAVLQPAQRQARALRLQLGDGLPCSIERSGQLFPHKALHRLQPGEIGGEPAGMGVICGDRRQRIAGLLQVIFRLVGQGVCLHQVGFSHHTLQQRSAGGEKPRPEVPGGGDRLQQFAQIPGGKRELARKGAEIARVDRVSQSFQFCGSRTHRFTGGGERHLTGQRPGVSLETGAHLRQRSSAEQRGQAAQPGNLLNQIVAKTLDAIRLDEGQHGLRLPPRITDAPEALQRHREVVLGSFQLSAGKPATANGCEIGGLRVRKFVLFQQAAGLREAVAFRIAVHFAQPHEGAGQVWRGRPRARQAQYLLVRQHRAYRVQRCEQGGCQGKQLDLPSLASIQDGRRGAHRRQPR